MIVERKHISTGTVCRLWSKSVAVRTMMLLEVSYSMEGVLPGLRKCPIVADVAFPWEDVGKIPVQCTMG